MTGRYPLLDRIPAEERPAWISQAEAGIPLSPEQAARLGVRVAALVLLPADGCDLSAAQLEAVCAPENRPVLGEVVGVTRALSPAS